MEKCWFCFKNEQEKFTHLSENQCEIVFMHL